MKMILEKTKPAQGSWTTSKVYTLGGGDIGFIIGEREISGQNNTDKWYHYDRLGNVMAQTNSSGQALATYEQDAFGNVLSGSANGYHLTTKEQHNDVGLYYFYQRWYDSILGRFSQKDKMCYVNKYLYCENNPNFFVDPLGLFLNPIGCIKRVLREVTSDFANDKFIHCVVACRASKECCLIPNAVCDSLILAAILWWERHWSDDSGDDILAGIDGLAASHVKGECCEEACAKMGYNPKRRN